jgi:hypothetical protein
VNSIRTVFSARLGLIYRESGLSLPSFTNKHGFQCKSFEKWIYEGAVPRAEGLVELAMKLDVSLDWLFGLKEGRCE